MKWQFTILSNVFVMFGFWLAGFIAILPAFNHYVQYAEINDSLSLPLITSIVFSVRLISLLLPIFWLMLSIALLIQLKHKSAIERIERIQLHTSLSILGGLVFLIVFALAGVLPFLQIAESIVG